MPELIPRLHRIRRAFHVQMFLARLAETALVVSCVWVAWAGLLAFSGHSAWQPGMVAAVITIALAVAGGWTYVRRLSLPAAAARLDRMAATHDRFTTALALSTPADELETSAARECQAFLASFDEKPWTRLRLPRRFLALAVPVVVTIMLAWFAKPQPPSADDVAKRAAAQARAHALEQMAAQAEQLNTPELKRTAEQMKQSAREIAAAKTGDEAEKTALRAISEIEAGLKNSALAGQQAQLDALAKALAATPQTKPAAKNLQDRKMAEAAQALADAAKKMDAETAKKLAEAMKQALQQLGEEGASGALARQMSQMAQTQSGNQSNALQQVLQQLAQMLSRQAGGQTAQNSPSQNGGNSPTEQQLLNMLENLKQSPSGNSSQSLAAGKPKGDGQQGQSSRQGNGSQTSMSDFAKSGQPVATMQGLMPSGQPGTEKDSGTTKTPYGEKNALGKPGAGTQLQGLLGQGESLQSLVQSADGKGAASTKYRALYQAMAPEAEQTVDQEAIPAGSRAMVKQYFESIRPQE
ncbi:MAG: hypothetical protein QM796_10285 [Chthoniobacteraceae bacterium]